MLEDCMMEKKNIRSVQPLGKGLASDPKKGQDGSGGKAFPRSSRRRETTAASAPKYEQVRKPSSQKGKTLDKRPRPRGSYMENRKEGPQVAEEEADYGSVISQGSKKQNLNHLLNFHYAPREGTSQHWRNSSNGHGHGSGLARYLRGAPHKYNKEQFLQAKYVPQWKQLEICQFVVKAGNDYRQYLCNPDQLVDWNMVEEIRIMSAEETSCPICLYPPVASKMTRCGHIFCWSCILHYLALSDKTWRKCPICYESVHQKDLKSVQALKCTPYAVGGEIILRLMRRERGSLEAVPVEQWEQRPLVSMLSVSEKAVDITYAKLLLAETSDVLTLVECERAALQKQMKEEEGSPEVCFMEQAMEILLERETLLKGTNQEPVDDFTAVTHEDKHLDDFDKRAEDKIDLKDDAESTDTSEKSTVNQANRPRHESMSSEDGCTAITAEDLEHSTMQQPLKHFFFYQAVDGQLIYLHAINARMLEMGYGSLEHCPLTISGRIVEKETGSMTEELRRRLRYLQHLPITCQFEVVEIDLGPPVISEEIVHVFSEQVDARRRRRNKRAREEWRRERKINEEENRRWGRHPTPRIRIASHHHFPICGVDNSPPMVAVSKSPSVTSLASNQSPHSLSLESLSLDPPPQASNMVREIPLSHSVLETNATQQSSDSGPSFAQMLRSGKSSAGGAWGRSPPSTSLARSMLSVSGSRQRTGSDSEPEIEGYVPAPTFRQSFSDAIAIALAKSAATNADAADCPSNSGKRKKKQKPKLLFSTTMACSGK